MKHPSRYLCRCQATLGTPLSRILSWDNIYLSLSTGARALPSTCRPLPAERLRSHPFRAGEVVTLALPQPVGFLVADGMSGLSSTANGRVVLEFLGTCRRIGYDPNPVQQPSLLSPQASH
jgi:hypothetical protein